MRWCRPIIMFPPMAAVCLFAATAWAIAGQPDGGLDLTGSVPGWPSAESGKPALGAPTIAPEQGGGGRCAPPLPCGTRLFGSVRRNGAMELQVPALRW